MATHPRKFQEKIAVIEARQTEGTYEFEKIMAECQSLTHNPPSNVSSMFLNRCQKQGAKPL